MAAAETADATGVPPKKPKGKKGIIIAGVVSIVLGGAAYYGISSGLIPIGGGSAASEGGHLAAVATTSFGGIVYVKLDPMVLSLGPEAQARHLSFSAELETVPEHQLTVEHLKPRFQDVLNTYLRAVAVQELESPAAMSKLRAQILRRLQIVAGNGIVSDLLITEFVLN